MVGLDTPFPENQIPSLKISLKEYGDSIVRAAKTAPFIDVPLALQLRESALDILNRYGELDLESKKAGAAAVKYFLLRDDARNGFLKPGGFEDDAMVLRAATSFIAARESGMVGRSWAA